MKILESILRDYAALGLGSGQLTQKHPLNSINAKTFSIFCFALISSTLYMLHDADSFEEYTISVFDISTLLGTISFYINSLWKNLQFHGVIEYAEKMINESKFDLFFDLYWNWHKANCAHILGVNNPESNANYVQATLLADKCSEIIHFLMEKIFVNGIVVPNFMFYYYNYYFTDLERDAFELVVPIWWDSKCPFDSIWFI